MKEIILVKNGELALKGLNRSSFESRLKKNIRRRIAPLGRAEIQTAQSTMFIQPASEGYDLAEAVSRIQTVFGIAGVTPAAVCEKNLEQIMVTARDYLKPELAKAKTFKVEARRADKAFPFKSPEICARLGGFLLEEYPHLTVDVHHPDQVVTVEVRDFGAYVHAQQLPGAGGMPTGTAGRAALLISGGIDSPVAAYMMAKRGLELIAVHFASPPYTSRRAEIKVHELLARVARYCGPVVLFTVPFTNYQQKIAECCQEDYGTILMRRAMMKISERIAGEQYCSALITGESLGQVASQTMQALSCTDHAVELPVFRPLIGMDKDEIVRISRKIDTFDVSIQPYEDCCTVFTPKHPRTKPRLADVLREEEKLDADALADEAINGTAKTIIKEDF